MKIIKSIVNSRITIILKMKKVEYRLFFETWSYVLQYNRKRQSAKKMDRIEASIPILT
jgi:hypothetical protein